jgi:hypothetical protein
VDISSPTVSTMVLRIKTQKFLRGNLSLWSWTN